MYHKNKTLGRRNRALVEIEGRRRGRGREGGKGKEASRSMK